MVTFISIRKPSVFKKSINNQVTKPMSKIHAHVCTYTKIAGIAASDFLVIRLGLEPRTPTLKV